jgi:hypothetical protein
MGKEALYGDQLSRTGGASPPVVRQISEVFVDMASFDLLCLCDYSIMFSQPGEKLLDICTIGSNRQRAFIQFAEKLV